MLLHEPTEYGEAREMHIASHPRDVKDSMKVIGRLLFPFMKAGAKKTDCND
jgi:hypothetical protein